MEQLHNLNQYCVNNAWFKVDFGGCPYGIFSAACPVEPLHAVENGLITTCLKILFEELIRSPSQKASLDFLAKQLPKLPRQRYASSGACKSMPRLLWKDGITTITETTANAKVGIMFTIVVIGLTEDGKQLFENIFENKTIFRNMMECFQMLLSYWMWLKKPTFWSRTITNEKFNAKRAISIMLQSILNLWPRQSGQGWELAKFHEQLHVPEDIVRFGSPIGTHSGPREHNHIQHVKC